MFVKIYIYKEILLLYQKKIQAGSFYMLEILVWFISQNLNEVFMHI